MDPLIVNRLMLDSSHMQYQWNNSFGTTTHILTFLATPPPTTTLSTRRKSPYNS